eukprot:Awhi_evm1s14166
MSHAGLLLLAAAAACAMCEEEQAMLDNVDINDRQMDAIPSGLFNSSTTKNVTSENIRSFSSIKTKRVYNEVTKLYSPPAKKIKTHQDKRSIHNVSEPTRKHQDKTLHSSENAQENQGSPTTLEFQNSGLWTRRKKAGKSLKRLYKLNTCQQQNTELDVANNFDIDKENVNINRQSSKKINKSEGKIIKERPKKEMSKSDMARNKSDCCEKQAVTKTLTTTKGPKTRKNKCQSILNNTSRFQNHSAIENFNNKKVPQTAPDINRVATNDKQCNYETETYLIEENLEIKSPSFYVATPPSESPNPSPSPFSYPMYRHDDVRPPFYTTRLDFEYQGNNYHSQEASPIPIQQQNMQMFPSPLPSPTGKTIVDNSINSFNSNSPHCLQQ